MVRVLRVAVLAVLSLLPILGFAESIRFWAVTGNIGDMAMYRSLADRFERRTGIHVDVTPLAWGSFDTKYFTSMAAGIPPDVGSTSIGHAFDYGTVGGLVDLRREFPKEIGELEGRFEPKLLGLGETDGHLYGLPIDIATLVLYYRTDIFRSLGIRPPRTWRDLNAAISRLDASGYRYYFGFTYAAQWAINLYTIPYGKPTLGRDAKGAIVVNWTDPAYQRGVNTALRLWHMHETPGSELGTRVLGMFRSDEPGTGVPLMLDIHTIGMRLHQTYPELDGKWATLPWPKADDGAAYNMTGGSAIVLFRKSHHKAAAFAWIKFLYSDEAQKEIVLSRLNRGPDSALSIPATRSIWSEANTSFWERPELDGCRDLVRVIRGIQPTFATVSGLHGATEASRIEGQVLDRMATRVRDLMAETAQRRDISRSELVKRFGQGRLPADRERIEATVARELREAYAEAAPRALKVLQDEDLRYRSRLGEIIENLPDYERRSSALDFVKRIVLAGLLLGAGGVAGIPRLRRHWISYAFVAVPLGLAALFVFVPAVVAMYLSATEYHPVLPLSTARWVGGENYAEALHSGELVATLGRTVVFALLSLPIGIALALVFAYLLNRKLRWERGWRFLFLSPLVTSVVSVALIFSQLFLGSKEGWINALLLRWGVTRDPIPFLSSEHTFLNAVIVLSIWHGLAFTILVLLAGLQQIPSDQFEAAALDGAGEVRRFWNVAVPGLRPQLFFVTVLGLIGSFQVFETIYLLAGKGGNGEARFGPNDSALTMVPLIYHTGFETFEMGKSAAIAYVLFGLILGLTAVQFRFYRRGE